MQLEIEFTWPYLSNNEMIKLATRYSIKKITDFTDRYIVVDLIYGNVCIYSDYMACIKFMKEARTFYLKHPYYGERSGRPLANTQFQLISLEKHEEIFRSNLKVS